MKQKEKELQDLSRSLARFRPEYEGCFICPTCLRSFPIIRQAEISQAHVLPKASGGTLKTYLCRKCNSTFGTRQDKWFGEYLEAIQEKNRTVLACKTRRGYFEIEGIRVGGSFEFTIEDGLQLFIWQNRTSPTALQKLQELRSSGGLTSFSVSIPIPLLEREKQRLSAIGFLTAAYLLWFKEFGYSWALQKHLEPIREQIHRPTESILPDKFIAGSNSVFENPCIGIGLLGGEVALVAGLGNHVVLLPPADRVDFYDRISRIDKENIKLTNLRTFSFYKNHSFDGPLGVLFGDCLALAPDALRTGENPNVTVLFLPPEGDSPQLLYPIPENTPVSLPPDAIRIRSRRGRLAPLA